MIHELKQHLRDLKDKLAEMGHVDTSTTSYSAGVYLTLANEIRWLERFIRETVS